MKHKFVFSLILTCFFSQTIFLVNSNSATLLKRDDFTAYRIGKGMQATWYSESESDSRFTLYQGAMFVIGKNAVPSKYLSAKYKVLTLTSDVEGKNGVNLYYLPSHKYNFYTKKWIYSQKISNIDDQFQAVVLESQNGTFDYKIIDDRAGWPTGDALRLACQVARFGEPAARGILSFSHLALNTISVYEDVANKSGVNLSGSLDTLLTDFAVKTGAETINIQTTDGKIDTIYAARGNATVIMEQSVLRDPSFKPGKSLNIKIAQTDISKSIVKKIKKLPKGGKIEVTLDVIATARAARNLSNTLSQIPGSIKNTNSLCKMLN